MAGLESLDRLRLVVVDDADQPVKEPGIATRYVTVSLTPRALLAGQKVTLQGLGNLKGTDDSFLADLSKADLFGLGWLGGYPLGPIFRLPSDPESDLGTASNLGWSPKVCRSMITVLNKVYRDNRSDYDDVGVLARWGRLVSMVGYVALDDTTRITAHWVYGP